jgi:4-carboxymuconolactone decarboxylase
MKRFLPTLAAALCCASALPAAATTAARATTADDVRAVSPALQDYAQGRLAGDVWKRPGLAPRDRSLITVAVLVARLQTAEMAQHMNLALDNGVKPAEISELITHLAFYAGWGQAMAAVPVAREVFVQRRIKADELPPVGGARLPLNEAAEAQRAARVQADVGPVSPGVVQYTGEVLFKDLWLRPALAPRDRSLVTVSSLIANGQVAQMPYHLNRAMDNGLTQTEASEMLAHLAFYTGWPNVFSAIPVAKTVFESRAK